MERFKQLTYENFEAILICALLFPSLFLSNNMMLHGIGKLSSWGGFLILASVTVASVMSR